MIKMAPTICLTDYNGTTVADTSCSRSKLKPNRVNITRRRKMEVNQLPCIATSIYSPPNRCSSHSLADNPIHSHISEATLPNDQKRKMVYKDLQKLCDLVARTKSLVLRNYILEIMLSSMQRSVRNLPQSSFNNSPKNKNKNVQHLKELTTQKFDIITTSIDHVGGIKEKVPCFDSNRTESSTN
ncbi:uncharacterized protein [Chelonus insularis]|uniref:uncharacterized protein isoform X2 n=1 Tax=Chelonus insularis TaxID=460826 RepID=UPI001589AB84|nr:uncharacterized protein LOC118068817 isoform X2 [Chelonus insularis]